MAEITHKGNKVHTIGALPAVGSKAPDFRLTRNDLSDVTLADFAGKKKIVNIAVSLDTGICATSAKTFEKALPTLPNTVVLTVTRDLPFAKKRFCATEGLEQAITLSDVRDGNFGKAWGVTLTEGKLEGLLARCVVVLDANDKVVYAQQVPEIATDPDFEAAMAAARKA